MYKPFLIYTALGDSLTKGRGAFLSPNFVQSYAQMAQEVFNKQVVIHNYSKGGLTSEQILSMFSDPGIRYAIYHSDLLTITAGGNDLLKAGKRFILSRNGSVLNRASNKAIKNIEKMIDEISSIKSYTKAPYLIRIVDLYNPVPKVQDSDYWIRLFNYKLKKKFTRKNIAVTNIHPKFKKEKKKFLSVDGLHPNKLGYRTIAESLHQLGYEPLLEE